LHAWQFAELSALLAAHVEEQRKTVVPLLPKKLDGAEIDIVESACALKRDRVFGTAQVQINFGDDALRKAERGCILRSKMDRDRDWPIDCQLEPDHRLAQGTSCLEGRCLSALPGRRCLPRTSRTIDPQI
jgi:hypothetical protein